MTLGFYLDISFSLRIQSTGSFVQKYESWRFEDRPRYGNTLLFTTAELQTTLTNN